MEDHERLMGVIEKLEGKLNIFQHDVPDPDSIASALLLEYIIRECNPKVESQIYYFRKPQYLANRALMNTLNLKFTKLNVKDEIKGDEKAALVDVPVLENLTNSEKLDVIIDIDHHKDKNVNKKDQFIYYEPTGACTSILLDFINKMGLNLDKEKDKAVIIASYLGLKIDTGNFGEDSMTEKDIKSKEYLEKLLTDEHKTLIQEIENTPVPASWVQMVEDIGAPLLYKGIGILEYDEGGSISYAADKLLESGNFKTVIIYGLVYEMFEKDFTILEIQASGRSKDPSINLDEAFGNIFYKTTPEGKIKTGGGKKVVGQSIARAAGKIDLMAEKEIKDKIGLKLLYGYQEYKINSRIESQFKIVSD